VVPGAFKTGLHKHHTRGEQMPQGKQNQGRSGSRKDKAYLVHDNVIQFQLKGKVRDYSENLIQQIAV